MSEKRDKVLKAALKLFTEKGIDSTSTASIAKEAGVATGTVFHHFENKDDLVKECFIFVKKKLRKSLEEVQSDDFFEMTRLYWKTAISWHLEHPMETSFINIYQHDPKVNGGKSLSVIIEMSGLIISFFEEAKRNGLVKDFSSDYFCLQAHNSTILAAQYLAQNPEIDRDKFIESSGELFMKGVLAN